MSPGPSYVISFPYSRLLYDKYTCPHGQNDKFFYVLNSNSRPYTKFATIPNMKHNAVHQHERERYNSRREKNP